MKLDFVSATSLLKEACIPQPPSVLWQHPKEQIRIEASGVHIICSDDARKSVRLSMQIAGEVARTKKPVTPTRGVNPFTGVNESEEYDAMLAEEAKNLRVLYINTLTTLPQLEAELIETLPEMDRWLWMDRDRGSDFPYQDLSLFMLSVQSGTIMKEDERKTFKQFIKQNKIDLIVVNSFEYACRTQREKDDMVHLLKEVRDERCAAILVFTHESEKRVAHGASRRGPMGALSILANFVTTIEKLAPELYVPGVCETAPEEAEQFDGFDGPSNTYQDAQEVQTMLHDAPASSLPRQHIRTDGSITDERFDIHLNDAGDTVERK